MACIIEDNNPADIIFGCTDPSAANYSFSATTDDGSCIYSGGTVVGCMDPLALNYNPLATIDPHLTCIYEDCPTELVIGIKDGIVYYTDTDDPQVVPDGSGIIEFDSHLTKGGQQPSTPLSLSEICCTEAVVGQPVLWDGENCVITTHSNCPEPLATTIDGVVISNVGTPVDETCCQSLEYATWDSNYVVRGNRIPGACISNNVIIDDCDLSLLDVILNSDGTVVVPVDVEPVIVEPEGTGGDIINNDGCVQIDSWQVADIEGDNTWLVILDTTDVAVLDLQIGQQINLSGFDLSPSSTCYGISSILGDSLNGVVSITNILDFGSTYSIITDIDVSTDALSSGGNTYFNCNGNDGIIDVAGSGLVCPIYGEPTTTTVCEVISEFSAFSFTQPAVFASPYVGYLNVDWATNCGLSLNDLDYFITIELSDLSSINLCDIYNLNDDFWTALSTSCYAPHINTTPTALRVIGITNIPNQTNQFVYLGLPLAFNDGDILLTDALETQGSGTCDEPYIEGVFNLCNNVTTISVPEGSNQGSGGGGSNQGSGGEGSGTSIIDIITTETVSIDESCCNELGNGIWEFIDGLCYWKPPKGVVSMSIGISENDIIVTDDACDTLTVCLSFFLERPEGFECFDDSSDITANLGAYSGDIETNIFTVSQNTTYSSISDGYCTWVELCGTIDNYDGSPFKLKLNIDGALECCEYDIFVDDISVSCEIQDRIQVSTKNDCPGFTLNKVIDNKKSWVYNDGETTNRVFAPSADAELPWRYTNYVEQSGVYEHHSKLVLNSKELYLTFNMCTPENCDTQMNVFDLIEYKNNFQNFWVKFMEQFVPSTTIFVSGEKWCNKPDEICSVMDDCDYDNNFSNSDLGTIKISSNGGDDGTGTNTRVDPTDGDNDVVYDESGDHASSRDDGPIIFDNFIADFIKYDPTVRDDGGLTFPNGLVPLLRTGMTDFRNKMRPPVVKLVR